MDRRRKCRRILASLVIVLCISGFSQCMVPEHIYYSPGGNFCWYTSEAAYVWDKETGTWHVETGDFEWARCSQGNFCVAGELAAYVWDSETKTWYVQTGDFSDILTRGSQGNFCVAGELAAYVWDRETKIWYVQTGASFELAAGSHGNFCVAEFATARVWDSETKIWYVQTMITEATPGSIQFSQGNFSVSSDSVTGTDGAVCAWSKQTKIWSCVSTGVRAYHAESWYEVQDTLDSLSSTDLNGDGVVNFADFAKFADDWLSSRY
ncbi:MAG: WD40 repeat domain-containing protein [Planctomycetes bacterium]|nr:WD40 repeat domain-containing protein [Planctomycetota bacterium]